jgi:hypothetical protein
MMWAPDYPWGATEETERKLLEFDRQLFGPREQTLELLQEAGLTEADEPERLLEYYRSSTADEQRNRRTARALGHPRADTDRLRRAAP